MFTNSPFHLKYGRRTHVYCPVCGLRFEGEPAFYEGALYFNYAMNVGLMLASGLFTYHVLGNPNQWIYFGVAAGTVVSMVSFTSRLSKSMMLHAFRGVPFEPEKWKKTTPSPQG